MELALLWLQLAGAAVVILAASTHLAKSADVIALKTGLGRSFVGVVLVATATSIPELGTGVSAITVVGEPDLAVGDALGSCIFNLAALAVLDLYWRKGPLLRRTTATPAVVGVLGVAVTAVAAIGMFVHAATDWFSTWTVSPGHDRARGRVRHCDVRDLQGRPLRGGPARGSGPLRRDESRRSGAAVCGVRGGGHRRRGVAGAHGRRTHPRDALGCKLRRHPVPGRMHLTAGNRPPRSRPSD